MSTEETALLQRLSRVANEWHCFPMSAIAASEIVAFQALVAHGYVTEANVYSFALTPTALDALQMIEKESAQKTAEKKQKITNALFEVFLVIFAYLLGKYL